MEILQASLVGWGNGTLKMNQLFYEDLVIVLS